jgi:heat-inducible transcriptional repressor
MSVKLQLTPRQQEILRRVVEEYVATGQPVGSKTLVTRGLNVSPSTVRAELAELESLGLLTHPHTSAGRVPTEHGYRYFADELLARPDAHPDAFPLDLHTQRTEVEAALQATTEMLSQVTRLLALVSAPPLEVTTVVHVEVLRLQPELVMVVVITSSGGVTKRLFHFEEPVDSGLTTWAGEYLNETVAGLQLGASLLRRRFDDPGLSPRERDFLAALRPAFTELVSAEQRLFVGGAADLLGEVRAEEREA